MPRFPRHGVAPHGNYAKLFGERAPCEPTFDEIERIVERLATDDGVAPNHRIPAGYTYLGQFIDHDLTFDAASKGTVNFRTPTFDLDSVYGGGPEVAPFLYDWRGPLAGTKFLTRRRGVEDLQRNAQQRALVGDPRNDEHQIISQLHLLFLRFHNAVVDRIAAGGISPGMFESAREVVLRHYRWVVVDEFIRTVTGGPAPVEPERVRFDGEPFMPLEFSGAAYRFGHSMVRNSYALRLARGRERSVEGTLLRDLAGHRELTADRVIDWERFFTFAGFEEDVLPSEPIDTHVTAEFPHLPDVGDLARRNLDRGHLLGLASGQAVAEAMGVPVLSADEVGLDGGVATSTPLWFYVLREAELVAKGEHLGPLGAKLVGETLVALLRADPSYDPAWSPDGELGLPVPFSMTGLIDVARG